MNVAGPNVRSIRQRLGMSLRALADAADLDASTLSRIENGKQNVTEDLASRIAKALSVSQGMLFADPGLLDNAMLHKRRVPLLTASQLLDWRGPEGFDESPDQEYFHTEMSTGSRYMFAIRVEDGANVPEVRYGDVLIFDAKRSPHPGELIVAQSRDGGMVIGRLRLTPADVDGKPQFDVVPYERLFPVVTSGNTHHLVIRGVLSEQRRTFTT